MIPPGMRAAGGRAYKKGGRVGKADGGDVGAKLDDMVVRGRAVDKNGKPLSVGDQSGPPVSVSRRASGGGVTGKPMAKTKMAGAGSGQGREEKAEAAKRK